MPILLYGLWAFLERRDIHLIVACVLMCLVKEDMPMYVAGIALALFVIGRRLFGVILGVASIIVTLLLIFVVIPHFSYWGHYVYIGSGARGLRSVGEALTTFGQHLFSLHGLGFLLLIAVTAGIGVVRPVMLALLPTVVFRLMANDTVYTGFRYQYGVLLTAVAFVALIDGWAWLRTKKPAVVRGIGLLQVAALVALSVFGFLDAGVKYRIDMLSSMPQTVAEARSTGAQIPDGANVAADAFLAAQIVDRTTVQIVFPDWKDETGATIQADYVWLNIDTISYNNDATPWVEALITRLTSPGGGYVQTSRAGPFVLLQRG